MQTVIRPLALAVAVLSLAGSALAGPANAPSSPARQQAAAQPVSASSTKPAKEKAQTATTLVATGKIVQFDTTGQALTLSTSKGEQHFTVGPSARLQDSSHAITVADLGRMTGHKATVRYKEAAGEKTRGVDSRRVLDREDCCQELKSRRSIMKSLFRSALVATGLVIASAGAANAQLVYPMKFSTTFPFMVGQTSLPAGDYTVTPLENDHDMMQLTNGHTSVLVMTEKDAPKVPPRQDEVIFTKQGDTYILREFWDAATATGAEPIPAHAHASHDVKGAVDMTALGSERALGFSKSFEYSGPRLC